MLKQSKLKSKLAILSTYIKLKFYVDHWNSLFIAEMPLMISLQKKMKNIMQHATMTVIIAIVEQSVLRQEPSCLQMEILL